MGVVSSDVGSWLEGSADVMPDLVITDPPRAGLGADVIGFQRTTDAGNFATAVRRQLGLETKSGVVRVPGPDGSERRAVAKAYPISIDAAPRMWPAR